MQDGYQNCGNSGARSVQFFFFRVHFGNRRICQGSGTDYHYLPYEGVRPGRSEVSSDVKGMHVCGIIMTPTSDDNDYMNNEYLNLLIDMKIPVVLLDRDVKYSQLDGVFIDNENGAFNAVKLLLENGHRNIAMISGPLNTVPGRGREEGYRNAFEFMNVPLRGIDL